MILIADSGGSGTTWCLIHGENPFFFHSGSLHPDVINSDTRIPPELKDFASKIEQLFFYGTGCANAHKAEVIYRLLNSWFPGAKKEVFSDLVAIAHASQGLQPGLIGIIGTGASMGWFNGKDVEFTVTSKGKYCDPGGGARIGRILRKLYQNKQLPADLDMPVNEMVHNENKITDNHFTRFVMQNLDHSFLLSIVENELIAYFEYYMPTWKKHQNGLVLGGTIAWLGRSIIEEIANSYGVQIHQFIKEPVYPLAKFYISSSNSSSI